MDDLIEPETGYWVPIARMQVLMAEVKALRSIFDALSPIEKMVAAKQITAVRRLVEAAEAL